MPLADSMERRTSSAEPSTTSTAPLRLADINLSLYSFGYAAGFITDDRPDAAAPSITRETLIDLAISHGLGGVEIPVDRCFADAAEAEAWVARVHARGVRVTLDVEEFAVDTVRALLPSASRLGLRWVRIKLGACYGGNRHLVADFAAQAQAFAEALRALLPALRRWGIRLLIENHQDLTAEELVDIIGATSADHVGITWDVGNSLAAGDTPASFLRQAGGFIGNVHLKDYRLARVAGGVALTRCALGQGVVEFPALLAELRHRQGPVPMAIELGAQHARVAQVEHAAYWPAFPPRPAALMAEYSAFLDRHAIDGLAGSAWERGLPGAAIVQSELDDLRASVDYLQRAVVGHA
jgi:sugar phosphate isomerase/epimerase